MLGYLEPMVNKNILGLRCLALKAFSELINHCRNTAVVTEQIQKTRIGLQRICMDYIEGLSRLYFSPSFDEKGEIIYSSETEKAQILKTLKDFSSVAKSVKLSNLFLESFAQVAALIEQMRGVG